MPLAEVSLVDRARKRQERGDKVPAALPRRNRCGDQRRDEPRDGPTGLPQGEIGGPYREDVGGQDHSREDPVPVVAEEPDCGEHAGEDGLEPRRWAEGQPERDQAEGQRGLIGDKVAGVVKEAA